MTTDALRELYKTDTGHALIDRVKELERRLEAYTDRQTGMTGINSVESVQVLLVNGIRGDGVTDPIRQVKQFWTTDGKFIGIHE